VTAVPGEEAARPRFIARVQDNLHRFFDGDVFYSFRTSPVAVGAFLVTLLFFVGAFLAPWIAPHNTHDVGTLNLMDAFLPPVWVEGGRAEYLLGTDDQGRDVLSSIMFGARVSLIVGFASVILSVALGVTLGLLSGYVGGRIDTVIMRVADVQLSFPAILIALLIDGFARSLLPRSLHEEVALYVLILAIGISNWVQFARTVRGSVLVEKGKEYVQAARVIGIHPLVIMVRHVLPNVLGPVIVLATLFVAFAVLTASSLSFLGVGVQPPTPSWGNLLNVARNISVLEGFPWQWMPAGAAIVLTVLAVNFIGDGLRDALDPRMKI
jgi:peptide/nickel transport system permease protein